MYADKFHYMTIAASNETDVAAILKNVDPRNKVRFERPATKKKRTLVKKNMNKQPEL